MTPPDAQRKLLGTTTEWPTALAPTTTPPSSPPPPRTPPVLPDELIVGILVRLPVRSLLQFRSVCKSWKTLISSHQFAKDHLQRSIADPTMTHPRLACSSRHVEGCKVIFYSIQPLFENPSASAPTNVVCFEMDDVLDVLGSCNGLLCLRRPVDNSVRLWNPCTRLASEWLKIELAYFTYHGFGYDHVHDKYKLLVGAEKYGTKVYTFGSDSWTTIQHFPFLPIGIEKFVSGTLNWTARVPDTTNQWVILSFDLAKETSCQVSLPGRDDHDNLCEPFLGVLRNCLCVCFAQNTHWAVWLMKEYGVQQSWTKLVMISNEEPLYAWRRVLNFETLYITENDDVLADAFLAGPSSSKLVLYNSNDGRLDYPQIDSRNHNYHIHNESLVSPSHCGLQSFLYGLTVD